MKNHRFLKRASLSLLLTFCFFSAVPAVFPAPVTSGTPVVQSYDELLQAIRNVRKESRERIEDAARVEKIREAWETGKLIDEHILLHKERAEYGAAVLKKLAVDLGTSHTELKYMLQFARTYPIGPAPDQLTWSHYRELLSVNDQDERQALTDEAEKNGWGMNRLRLEIKKHLRPKDTGTVETAKLEAVQGKFYTYRVIQPTHGPFKGKLALDLGFSVYANLNTILTLFYHGKIKDEVMSQIQKDDFLGFGTGGFARLEEASDKDRYTYRVDVIDVIDGDTFHGVVDLGFGMTTTQTLRLRGLDAPEMDTNEGRKAKAFLKKRIFGKDEVVIRSSKSDKYDRYLVDVWVDEKYVNQELIDQGYANITGP